MSKQRPDYLISISEFARRRRCGRTTAHRWAAQGRLGPVCTWGNSGVALLDTREMARRGYVVRAPERAQFTASQVREAIALAGKQESAS